MAWHTEAKTSQMTNKSYAVLPPATRLHSEGTAPKKSYSLASVHRKKKTSSLGGLVRNIKHMFPSRKPEKGYTLRPQSYQAPTRAVEDERAQQRRGYCRVTISPWLRDNENGASDRIVQWNIARDLSIIDSRLRQPRRAISAMTFRVPKKHDVILGSYQASFNTTKERRIPIVQHKTLQDWQSVEHKAESRRQRRSLKESGDYLGVQGINPQTGQLDILSTTDSGQSNADSIALGLLAKSGVGGDETHPVNLGFTEALVKLKRERERERQKLLSRIVYWKRQTKQWYSAHEASFKSISQPATRGEPAGRAREPARITTSPKARPGYNYVGPGTVCMRGRGSAAPSPESQVAEAPMMIPGSYPAAPDTEDGHLRFPQQKQRIALERGHACTRLWRNHFRGCSASGPIDNEVLASVLGIRPAAICFAYIPNSEERRLRDVIIVFLSIALITLVWVVSVLVFGVASFVLICRRLVLWLIRE